MPHPLDTFFAPDSIALIGASRDLEKIPGRLLSMLRKNGFAGKIYPINPNYGDIDGLKCYPSIAEVGQPIDLAIVIIPARAVLGALEQCAAAGVKNAVIISSGFAEEGGDSAAMQDAIVTLAKKTGMRISGPNAEGFYSHVQRVAATFSPTIDVKPGAPELVASRRRIGIVAQSGGIGFAIYHRAKALGIALSYVISAGNESDLGAGEFFDYMVQDASTDVILLFIEGIRDVDKFLAAARRAAEAGKPVIVTKVGRSGAGERAAASHTASMAGWSAAYDAVFAKYGFIVSNDLDEAVTIAAVLTTNPLPKGDRVAVPCQTTLSVWDTEDLIGRVQSRYPNAEVHNEICRATQERQEAAVEAAKLVDLVIVVGSPRSSNSLRLVEVVKKLGGKPAYLVDRMEDIESAWFKGATRVGVTSGASTPTQLTRRVIEHIEAMEGSAG